MNRDDALRIIEAAGWSGIYTQWTNETARESMPVPVTMEQIMKAFALVAARERKECAKVCDALANDKGWHDRFRDGAAESASLIRARGGRQSEEGI